MPDPRPVHKGQPLKEVLTQENINFWMKGAVAALTGKGGAGTPALDSLKANHQILVQNESGADVPAFAILGLLDPFPDLTDPDIALDFLRRPVFDAGLPSQSTNTAVITTQAIPKGEVGKAIIGGLAVARVKGVGAWAAVVDGETDYLQAFDGGDIKVVFRSEVVATDGTNDPDDTGDDVRLAVVLLGSGGGSGDGGVWIRVTSEPSGGWYEGELGDFYSGFFVEYPSTGTDPIHVRPCSNTPLAVGQVYRCWPDTEQEETGLAQYIASVPPSVVRTVLEDVTCNPDATDGPTITKEFIEIRVLLPEPD
jgi:hypothetical protein